jgi:tetratricopeptide (TPR) repeat protein
MEEIILDLSKHLRMFNRYTNPELLFAFKSIKEERTVQNRLNTEWFHYFLKVVMCIKPIFTGKETFVTQCKVCYKDNATILEQLSEFEEWYEPDMAIFWYTRDNFLYKLLNKAFRQKNRDLIWLMHFFIVDLYEQLRSDCLVQSKRGWVTEVYRGQLMTKEELSSLKFSLHCTLSVNSFFSTTVKRDVALIFSGAGASGHLIDDDLQPVLFQISCNGCDFEQQTFANIKDRSINEDEEEVMFPPGTMFAFRKLFYDDTEKVWIANLQIDTLLADLHLDLDRRILKLETLLEQKRIETDNDAKKTKLSTDDQIPINDEMKNDFQSLLHELSSFDQYMKLCKINFEVSDGDTKFKLKRLKALRDRNIVPDIITNDMQICIYDCLGIINIGNLRLTHALNYFSIAENIDSDKMNKLARKVNIASEHKMNGDYVTAWQLCKEVLNVIDISSSEDDVFGTVGIASCEDATEIVNIETLYEYEKFTDFVAINGIEDYENVVRSAYLDIGDHYQEINQLSLALKCYQRAIEIPLDDSDSNADCYQKCSEILEKQNDFDGAIEFRTKMHIEYSKEEDVYASTCKDAAVSYGRLGTLYFKHNKIIESFQSFHRSFTYWSKQVNWKRIGIENEELMTHEEDPIYEHLVDIYEELAAVIVKNDAFETFCLERAVEFRLMVLHIGLRMN